MVRVAGLRRQVAAGVVLTPPDGLTPQEQLDAIDAEVARLSAMQRGCLTIAPRRGRRGTTSVSSAMRDLTAAECGQIDAFFESQIFPVLTPLAVDPGHPFPYISNLSLSLAVEMRDPEHRRDQFARVKVPKSLPRWIPVRARPNHFVPLEQVIGANLDGALLGNGNRRARTRSESPAIPISTFQRRRAGRPARDDRGAGVPAAFRRGRTRRGSGRHAGRICARCLLDELSEDDVAEIRTPEGARHRRRRAPARPERPEQRSRRSTSRRCKDVPFVPATPPELRDAERNIFDVIRERDLLVHHPFDSFGASVERLLEDGGARRPGARDQGHAVPHVGRHGHRARAGRGGAAGQAGGRASSSSRRASTRQTTSRGRGSWRRSACTSRIGSADAQDAREDRARRPPRGGRHPPLHPHRHRQLQLASTARLYTDIGLFTCSPSIGADVSDLFNSLTGYSRQRLYRKLLVAPVNMRERFLELIEREAEHAAAGRPARIVGKMNALVDAEMIDALYRASQAGVEIDLIVRGICCLRPRNSGRERPHSRREHRRPLPRALAALVVHQRRRRGVLPRLR